MKALSPTKTFAQLAQATNRFGTKAKNNCDMSPSARRDVGSQKRIVTGPPMVTGADMVLVHYREMNSQIHILKIAS